MLTPQEVTSIVFEKAVFGGYEINAVDRYLNQLTKDYSALYKDNELLKKRMAAMSEKLEEYRVSEDAMRLALLSAKKAAKESAEKAKELETLKEEAPGPRMNDAEAAEQLGALAAELKREEAALRRARETTATYLARFREATAACESALLDLYGEAEPDGESAALLKDLPAEAERAAASEESAGTDWTDMNFSDLNFGRS